MDVEPIVFVISGDAKGRRNVSLRLKQLGCDWRLYQSPEGFRQDVSPKAAGCILLQMIRAESDLNWLATLGELCEDRWPVIAIAAKPDVETAVQAMKRGAFDFLLDSCNDQRLRSAIDEAFRRDADQRRRIGHVQSIRRRLKQLAPPLREVLDLLLRGKSNREIADELGMSVRSIEVRRAKVMQAMKARKLATLIRLALLAHDTELSRTVRDGDRHMPTEAQANELEAVDRRSHRWRPAK
jgi:FixJ family two-component response regulator